MKSRWILLKGVHSPYEQYSAKWVVVKVESEVSGVYRTESRLENLIYRIIFNVHDLNFHHQRPTTFFRYLSLKPINRLRFTKLSGEQGGTEVDIKINHAEANSPACKTQLTRPLLCALVWYGTPTNSSLPLLCLLSGSTDPTQGHDA